MDSHTEIQHGDVSPSILGSGLGTTRRLRSWNEEVTRKGGRKGRMDGSLNTQKPETSFLPLPYFTIFSGAGPEEVSKCLPSQLCLPWNQNGA